MLQGADSGDELGRGLEHRSDDIAKKFKEDCASDGGKAHWAKLHFDALKRGLTRGPGCIFRRVSVREIREEPKAAIAHE